MKRSVLSIKLDNLTGTPLKAMLWHLNETVNDPYITADNMGFCTDLAIYEALSLLEKESADMYQEVVSQLGVNI